MSFLAIIIILSPYLSKPISIVTGQILVMALLSFFVVQIYVCPRYRFVLKYRFLMLALFMFIYPHIISFIQRAGVDFNLLKIQISVAAVTILGFVINFWNNRYTNLPPPTLIICKLFVGVIVFNSIVVLLEFYFPALRFMLEGFLIPDGKVDYFDGLRYRGLASAGGASLSVAHGVGAVFLYYLFRKGLVGPFITCTSLAIIVASLIFIGRTGFVIVVMGFITVKYLTHSITKKITISFVVGSFVILCFSILVAVYIQDVFYSLPPHYQNYSVNVFLGGIEGLKSEGTVSYVASFYSFPNSFPSLLLGTGNFSGGFDFGYKWPGDPGIMKMFTAYGVFGGGLFYLGIVVWCFSLPKGDLRDVLSVLVVLLMCTEFKEPLLFKGYSARLFWIFFGFSLYQRGILAIKNSLNWDSLEPKVIDFDNKSTDKPPSIKC